MQTDAKLAALNHRFSLPGVAEFVPGNSGLPKLRIATPAADAEVYLHGAQITSWKPRGQREVLFVSGKSLWAEGRAIRGGIPICFPWFRAKSDDPHAPSHGFVRTKEWELGAISQEPGGAVHVSLSTGSDVLTRKWWPFDFRLEYRITIGESLVLELAMRNTGQSPLQFEEALHTYFSVEDVAQIRVRGLSSVDYLDNREGNRRKTQNGDLVLTSATDNAFIEATGAVEIVDPGFDRVLRTSKQNSVSTIVWNPWREGAAALADLGDDEWRQMACVEGGNILAGKRTLDPGETHSMNVTIRVESGSSQ